MPVNILSIGTVLADEETKRDTQTSLPEINSWCISNHMAPVLRRLKF
jgi:hypothetical protein